MTVATCFWISNRLCSRELVEIQFWDLKSLLANPRILKKFPSSVGSNEFPVDELLRNLGVGIASLPPSPFPGTGCPVLVRPGILPASGSAHGVGILVRKVEGYK